MKKINLRVLIVGHLISWGIFLMISLIQNILGIMSIRSFRYPLGHYLLRGYLPFILSGIYVGFSEARHKVTYAIFLAILFGITTLLIFDVAIPNPSSRFRPNLYSLGYATLKDTLICAASSWLAHRFRVWMKIRKTRLRNDPNH